MRVRGVIRSLFGEEYCTVKLTDTAFCFSSHRPLPPRVILSEAAHRVQRRTRQPTIAAQRTPSPRRGASRRDLHCLNVACNAFHHPGTRTKGWYDALCNTSQQAGSPKFRNHPVKKPLHSNPSIPDFFLQSAHPFSPASTPSFASPAGLLH